MPESEEYSVGPMYCTAVIVPHKDFKITLRKLGTCTDHWNPTINYWGDERDPKKYKFDPSGNPTGTRVVAGTVQQDGKALLRANSCE